MVAAKLSPEQRQAIQNFGPVKDIAKEDWPLCSNVSKRLIQSILSPPVRKHSKQYPTEYWTELKRKYRKKKIDLYKNGKIKFNNKLKINETQAYQVCS